MLPAWFATACLDAAACKPLAACRSTCCILATSPLQHACNKLYNAIQQNCTCVRTLPRLTAQAIKGLGFS
eukprot:355346-Chlamydomonas_euryale.AAC.2